MWNEERFQYNVATALNNERLQLILYPTELCNFRCKYCYEDHKGINMSSDTVSRIKLFLSQRVPTLKVLEIEWFGGEPLLTKDIIIDISSHAKNLCEQYGVVFYAYLTSNGFLLDFDTFSNFCSLNILTYQITFDGDKDNHDKFRIRSGKEKASFDTIWSNAIETKRSNASFSFVLRCHLTAINQNSIDSLLVKIEQAFGDDKRYFVHLKEVSALGGPNDADLCLLKRDDIKDKVEQIKSKHPKLQYINIEEEYICYASKPNSFAIRSNGDIIKCTVAMDDEVNHLGTIEADGTLKLDKEKYIKWFKGFDNLDRDKLSCPYYRFFKKSQPENQD